MKTICIRKGAKYLDKDKERQLVPAEGSATITSARDLRCENLLRSKVSRPGVTGSLLNGSHHYYRFYDLVQGLEYPSPSIQ